MRTDKLLPRRGRLALRGRRDAMALQNVAHRLRTDRQAQVSQGADDPVIAPGAILPGYPDNQRFQLRVNVGTAWSLTLGGAIKLLCNQSAVPGEDGVGFD